MRIWMIAAGVLVFTSIAAAEHRHGAGTMKPAKLLKGLGTHHHPITTTNRDAQRFFDQGLTLAYGFNYEEALRSFQRAAALDPTAVMPLWGIAYVLGPNYNMDTTPENAQTAYETVQKARALAANAPEHERAYVEALAQRYSDDPKADRVQLNVAYKDAMARLAQNAPDDLDASVLYAESLMVLRPWKLWNADGTPAEGTVEIVAVFEEVLRRNPSHPGANHLYIHAVEASPHPERAWASAKRLETLVPAAGHLVHMPSHIYMRTGFYQAAAKSNAAAVAADRAYLRSATELRMYPVMYYSHNIHFLAAANAMAGRRADALRAARDLHAVLTPTAHEFAGMVDPILSAHLFVALRFNDWVEVLAVPEPDPRLAGAHAVWHFGRAVARAATGDATGAAQEQAALAAARQQLPQGAGFGFNTAADILRLASEVLAARLATTRGDLPRALAHWEQAVAIEDTLTYNEPEDWYYPTRESLGAALLSAGRAADAEAVFRAELQRHPRNPRALFGLSESLRVQGKDAAAALVAGEFASAWQHADVKLRLPDL